MDKPLFVTCPRCSGRRRYIKFVKFFHLFYVKRWIPCEVCHETGRIDIQPAKCFVCGRQINKHKIGAVRAFDPRQNKKAWCHDRCTMRIALRFEGKSCSMNS